jgi:hypothetical protein
MKKLAITLGLLAGATAAYAQGEINWSDYVATQWSITVFGPGTGASALPSNTAGNTSIDIPPGNATYSGAPLSGSGYTIGLYVDTSVAALQADVLTGTPIATSAFATGSLAGTWDTTGSLVAVSSKYPSGTAVYSELAAWSDATGNPTSYAAALVAGDAAGTSLPSSTTTVLGGGGTPPATPGNLGGSGITDFSIGTATPEPSTIALGVMGASAFLMRLRRK